MPVLKPGLAYHQVTDRRELPPRTTQATAAHERLIRMTDHAPSSRTALGKRVGRVCHDVHNIMTVLFGLADELESVGTVTDDWLDAHRTILQQGLDRIETVSSDLGALQTDLLADRVMDLAAVTRRLAAVLPALGPLQRGLGTATTLLQGDEAEGEHLLLLLAMHATQTDGFAAVGALEDAGDGTGRSAWPIDFHAPVPPELMARVESAAARLNGEAASQENGKRVVLTLARARS